MSPSPVFGFCTSWSSASNVFAVALFRSGLFLSTGMPTLNAVFSFGSALGSTFAAGRRRRERSAKFARNGRCTRKLSIAVCSVGGFFSIVC